MPQFDIMERDEAIRQATDKHYRWLLELEAEDRRQHPTRHALADFGKWLAYRAGRLAIGGVLGYLCWLCGQNAADIISIPFAAWNLWLAIKCVFWCWFALAFFFGSIGIAFGRSDPPSDFREDLLKRAFEYAKSCQY